MIYLRRICLIAFGIICIHYAEAQSISSVSPNSASRKTWLSVSITGQNTNFSQATPNTVKLTKVYQGSTYTLPASSTTPSSNTSLKANMYIPSWAFLGDWDLKASNSSDGNMTYSKAVNINSGPKILTIQPDSAINGQTLSVTITTQNMNLSQSSSYVVRLRQGSSTLTTGTNVSVVSKDTLTNQLSIPSPATAGWYDLWVNSVYKLSTFYVNSGSGSTSGNVVQSGKSAGPGDPVVGLKMILTSMQEVSLLESITDANGRFEFNYLPFGNYKIYGEDLVGDPILVSITEEHPNQDSMNITLQGDSLISGLNQPFRSIDLQVYPNPFSDLIHIKSSIDIDEFHVEVFNESGALLINSKNYVLKRFEDEILIEFSSGNPSGLYFVRITSEVNEFSESYKLIRY